MSVYAGIGYSMSAFTGCTRIVGGAGRTCTLEVDEDALGWDPDLVETIGDEYADPY